MLCCVWLSPTISSTSSSSSSGSKQAPLTLTRPPSLLTRNSTGAAPHFHSPPLTSTLSLSHSRACPSAVTGVPVAVCRSFATDMRRPLSSCSSSAIVRSTSDSTAGLFSFPAQPFCFPSAKPTAPATHFLPPSHSRTLTPRRARCPHTLPHTVTRCPRSPATHSAPIGHLILH